MNTTCTVTQQNDLSDNNMIHCKADVRLVGRSATSLVVTYVSQLLVISLLLLFWCEFFSKITKQQYSTYWPGQWETITEPDLQISFSFCEVLQICWGEQLGFFKIEMPLACFYKDIQVILKERKSNPDPTTRQINGSCVLMNSKILLLL